MASHDGKPSLKARRAKGLEALVVTSSVAEASRQSGIPVETLYRWIKDPAFAAKLDAARDNKLSRIVDEVSDAALGVAAKLIALADDPANPVAVRATSYKAILDLATPRRSQLEARFEAVHSRQPEEIRLTLEELREAERLARRAEGLPELLEP